MKKGVLQSRDGAVCIEDAAYVKFVAVSTVSRARRTTHQGQHFFVEVIGQNRRCGACTSLRLIYKKYKQRKSNQVTETLHTHIERESINTVYTLQKQVF